MFQQKIFVEHLLLEQVYIKPKEKLNPFEISPWGKISLRCKVTLLLALT